MTNLDRTQMTLSERLDRIEVVLNKMMNDDFMAGSWPASLWWNYVPDRSSGDNDPGDLAAVEAPRLKPIPSIHGRKTRK